MNVGILAKWKTKHTPIFNKSHTIKNFIRKLENLKIHYENCHINNTEKENCLTPRSALQEGCRARFGPTLQEPDFSLGDSTKNQ